MVEKKVVITNDKELKKVRDARKLRYDVTVRYRDGGLDTYYGVNSARVLDRTLEIVEGSMTVHLVLDVITHFRIVEVKE